MPMHTSVISTSVDDGVAELLFLDDKVFADRADWGWKNFQGDCCVGSGVVGRVVHIDSSSLMLCGFVSIGDGVEEENVEEGGAQCFNCFWAE